MAQGLNAAQQEAVETLSGPLLVLAGAGTGKTRVVTYRIANLIRHGVAPERILAVTFTNKAAGEMQERAGALLGKRRPTKPEISTFHSLCVRILRRQITRLGYPAEFSICDRGDQESVARTALQEIDVAQETLKPGDLVNQISRWKSASVRPAQASAVARTDKEHLAAAAYRRYQNALKASGSLDFDDLLLCTEELFEKHAEALAEERARFRHLLVDEYQDTNGSQYRIIKALASAHRNLCVVGDDDQSIYGWRGAEVAHILRFRRDWPEAKVVRLEDNYRSTAEIIALANRLIVFNKERHDKVLRASRSDGGKPKLWQCETAEAEAHAVVEEIRRQVFQREAQPRDIAILFRTNQQPRLFEQELRREKIPYVLMGSRSFYDRKEVRDVLAYLKLLAHPSDDVSLRRIINLPPRGITQSTVEKLTAAATSGRKSSGELLATAREIAGVSGPAATAMERFGQLIARYRQRLPGEPLAEVVTDLVREIRYEDELARVYKDPNEAITRWNAVQEVVNSLAEFQQRNKSGKLSQFLEEILLADREEEEDKETKLERNAVALMTLHSAKGLEFPQVFLVGMEEGFLPHIRSIKEEGSAIDEERRLCYVGVTRARDRLTISLALSRMKWGKPRPTIPSRFLFEMQGKADSPQARMALARITEEFGDKGETMQVETRVDRSGGGEAATEPRKPRSGRGAGKPRRR
ncbi:MAG: UvrD-helicase domain-containing protein [Planctomycetia bacterium]|nr:UvrD-helicase domain-containing protein [Planctomycetia bacterium]